MREIALRLPTGDFRVIEVQRLSPTLKFEVSTSGEESFVVEGMWSDLRDAAGRVVYVIIGEEHE